MNDDAMIRYMNQEFLEILEKMFISGFTYSDSLFNGEITTQRKFNESEKEELHQAFLDALENTT